MLWQYKNISLRNKILSGNGISLLLIILVLAWAIVSLQRLGTASDAILKENYKSILAAENMMSALERQDSATLLILAGYHEQGSQQFKENSIEFAKWLGRASDNVTIKGEQEIIYQIQRLFSAYQDASAPLRNNEISGTEMAELYYNAIFPAFADVRESCIHLRVINQDTMFKASDHTRSIARWAVLSMTIIGFGAVVIGFGFSFFLSQLITKPLKQITNATEELSRGNYQVNVSIDSKDEFGRLAQDFNKMALRLKEFHDMNIQEILVGKRRNDAIIRSIDDGVIVVDSDLRIISINPVALTIFDVNLEFVEGMHFWELIDNEILSDQLMQTIKFGQVLDEKKAENLLVLKRGEKTSHYQYSVTPVISKGEQMVGVILLLRDVTKLKELDKLKSEFVMAASHELRTPLTSIEMSVGLLQEDAVLQQNEKGMKLLAIMLEEIKRLKSLIDDLLDLAKIEAGKMPMDFSITSLKPLFKRAETILKNQALEHELQLIFNLPENLPMIRADVNKITWVLTNLVGNAIRFTGAGGYIKVQAIRAGQNLHISVEDNGEGIPHEFQSKIFDKFVQVKTGKDTGGTGLGLAICKEIIRAHSGTIWVESTPGKGTTFTFTLPVIE